MWRGHPEVLSPEAVIQRAKGRKWYNAWKQFGAIMRQQEVVRLRLEGYTKTAIASTLGVSRRTIDRDFLALMAYGREPICPTCGRENALPRAWFAGR